MQIRTSNRRRAATAGALAAVLVSGCGGNSEMGSSQRGAGSDSEETSVENAFIVPRFVPGSCAIQVGDAAELTFTVTNNRVTESEQLIAIDSPAAQTIRISPHATLEIPPGSSIAAGQPIEDVGLSDGDQPFAVSIDGLRESARPGTSVNVTFRFDQQGDLTMRVPIEACPTQKN
jgi:copper(I)-binding protein